MIFITVIEQARATAQRLRKDYLAVARPFGEKAADTIDALIEEVERCDEEYNKVLAEKEAHAQEDIKRLHRIEQKVDALIVERDALRAENERLKQKMFDESAAMVGIAQIKYPQALAERDTLRAQLAQAQDNNEFALPGGGYVLPTPTPERAPARRAVATDDPEIYEFWARNKEAEKHEPAKYSDIVSDGGMDPRNKFDVAPVQEPVTKPKLIGWRTADFLNETTDIKQARSWEVHYEVLPIFEGDPNTKLVTPPAGPVQEPPVWTATRLWNRRQLWTCPADIERDLMGGYTATPVETTQEPVAWMCSDENLVSKGYTRFSRNCEGAWNIPVYITPAAQKPKKGSYEAIFGHLNMTPDELGNYMIELQEKAERRNWVGLTDEEIISMSRYDLEYAALMGEVQRKLKEKNFS